ncbi:MFS transporter [Haloarchaeobius sp. DFWS5]|uniref:MFS transporter n=1 Tax=Haloarchaeobius sp. DFWS5 TaxID=3446114 RepID=UPI003EB70904
MSDESTERSLRTRLEHWLPLLVVCSAMLIVVIDTSMMTVAISAIVADLDTSVTAVQAAISLYALVMAAFVMVGAKLGNVYGLRRMYLVGLGIYTTGTILAAISWNIYVLWLGWSIIEGLGAAILLPLSYAILPLVYRETTERALAFGILTGVQAAAAAVGPIVGGTLTTFFTWRWGFGLEALIAVPTFLLALRLTEHRPEPDGSIDGVGAALSVTGLSLVTIGVLLSGHYGWWKALRPVEIAGTEVSLLGLSPTPILVAAGIALLVGFVHWQYKQVRVGGPTLVRTSLFGNGGYLGGLSTYFIAWVALGGILFVVPVFLQGGLGYNAFQTGIALLPFSMAVFAVSLGTARLTATLGGKRLIQAGILIVAVGLALLYTASAPSMTLVDMALPMLVQGVGIGLIMANIVNLTLSTVEADETMEASGGSMAVNWMGTSIGTAVMGSFLLTSVFGTVVDRVLTSAGLAATATERRELIVKLEDTTEYITEQEKTAFVESLPPAVQQDLLSIIDVATVQGFRNTVLLLGLFVVALALTSSFLPAGKTGDVPMETTPVDPVPDRADD